MAEIKSAIEIALERTKNMIPSPAEKEKLREEEDSSKALALVNRYLHVDLHFKDVEKELARMDDADRKVIEKLMIRHLAEAMRLEEEDELVFEGIATLRPEAKGVVSKIRVLQGKYKEQRREEYERVGDALKKTLEQKGISGSAVQPKVEGSPDWKDALARFRPAFEEQLASYRKELQK